METQTFANELLDIVQSKNVHRNLSVAQLVEYSLKRGEACLSSTGALTSTTGKYTGRSPKDRFIVDETSIHDKIAWGSVNQPISQKSFESIYRRMLAYLRERDELFVFEGFAGNDPTYRLPIRVVNEFAWQDLFVHQLFVRPTAEELASHQAEFTVIAAPGFQADPERDGTHSEACIIISFEKRVILIGGTHYAGEMKKSIFSIMNFLLPQRNVLTMHCSANVGKDGDVALFFGLSGTGKTTLSADPNRRLIGDDEHGWSDQGIFNIEGGCYAKCIRLSQEGEPQIWNAIRFGSVLENVVLDPETRVADYDDAQYTENTRAAYPVDYIDGAIIPGVGGHPHVIVFLTADAYGVLPPISKLTKEQAMYHFLSGYTSKLAGTERGISEPQATFSTCFGEPFLPLSPSIYAEMLGRKINQFNARVYLVNTGWSGGPYGVGQRMKLSLTRAMVTAAISGDIEKATFTPDPIFGLLIPDAIPDVPSSILQPRNTWQNADEYDQKARQLAEQFKKNFTKFTDVSDTIKQAGPLV